MDKMLRRTHLALGLAVALYFLPHVHFNKFIFLGIVLLSSVLPDVESGFSAARRHHLLSLHTSHVFHKNRILHTYTLLVPVTILIAIFYPILSLPFFLGYSFHLFLDSFTPAGIRPFWPLKHHAQGRVTPGGNIDRILFVVFLALDALLLFSFIMSA